MILDLIKNFFKHENTSDVNLEDNVIEEPIVEEVENTIKEEIVDNHEVSFSDDNIEYVINTIRPIIKSLNTDEAYIHYCENEVDLPIKRLKTFSKVSPNKDKIYINLTQSPIFNIALTKFMSDYVTNRFNDAIDINVVGSYSMGVSDGAIVIRKI